MPRLARIAIPGVARHVTQRGNNRQDIVFTEEDRSFYLEWLAKYASGAGLDILGCCLMTNHVHLVVVPKEADSLATGLGRAHWRYSQMVNRLHGRCGHLWQGRFFSCALDEAHAGETTPPAWLEMKRWSRWTDAARWKAELRCDSKEAIEAVRFHTRRGRPLGSDAFVAKMEALLGHRLRPLAVGRPKRSEQSVAVPSFLYTQYLRDGGQVVYEKTWTIHGQTLTPQTDKTYSRAGGRMAVTRQTVSGTTTFTYYATDHLGTVRSTVTVNTGGTEQYRTFHDFEPFGLEIPVRDTVSPNTHRFTGRERDAETGSDYMHFRYYAGSMGRFMKPDNIPGNLANPQSWNLYSYVVGNPVNYNDPTGHMYDIPGRGGPPSLNPFPPLGTSDGTEGWDAEYMNGSDAASPHNTALAEIQNLQANWSVWNSPMAASGIATYHAGQSTGTWDDATQTMTVTANGYWTMSSRYWAGSSFAGASTELGSIIGRVWLTQIKYKFPWYVLGEGCYQAAYALQRDIQAMKPKYWVTWIGERDSPPWPHYFVVLVPTEQNPMFGDPIIIDPYVGFTVRPFPSNGDYHLGDTGSYPLGR